MMGSSDGTPLWDETLTQQVGERGINTRVGNVRRCDAGANWRVAWGNPTAACKPWLLALPKFQQYRTRAWPYRASKSRINTRQAPPLYLFKSWIRRCPNHATHGTAMELPIAL